MIFSALVAEQRSLVCDDGGLLLEAGDPADSAYVLQRGAVELVWNVAPYEGLVVAICAAPDVIGLDALLTGRPYGLSARALGPVSYVRLDAQGIEAWQQRDPSAVKTYADLAAKRESSMLATLGVLLGPADDRLQALLAEYARYCGRPEGAGNRLLIRRTQDALGKATALTPRHVHRLLQRFEEAGTLMRDAAGMVVQGRTSDK